MKDLAFPIKPNQNKIIYMKSNRKSQIKQAATCGDLFTIGGVATQFKLNLSVQT